MSADNPFAVPEDFDPSSVLDQDDLELYKADRGTRWLGAFVDGLIGAAVGAPFAIMGAMATSDDPELLEAMIQLGFFGGYMLIAPLNWYFIVTRGQSLGKMAVKTRIVDENGGPVDFVKGVVVRNWVIAVASACIPFAGLIDAVLIFGDKKQCGHDMLAKTIVVQASAWNPYDR